MPTKYLYILLFIFAIGCTNDNTKIDKPKNAIEKAKLEKILVDIHIADAILAEQKLFDKDLDSTGNKSYYNYIFVKHDVTRKQFDETMRYYLTNSKELTLIYENVTAIIKEKEESFKKDKDK